MDSQEALTDEEIQLSSAIIAILTDEQLSKKYKEKSSERSRDFSPKAIMKQWVQLIDELTRNQNESV